MRVQVKFEQIEDVWLPLFEAEQTAQRDDEAGN
jgi:hypothetical protein